MEKELASKIFMINDYACKNNMEEQIKEYIRKLKLEYPTACITREFYKGENILIRATQIIHIEKAIINNIEKQKEIEKEEGRIREKGINGLGENVYREKNSGTSRSFGHNGGKERER